MVFDLSALKVEQVFFTKIWKYNNHASNWFWWAGGLFQAEICKELSNYHGQCGFQSINFKRNSFQSTIEKSLFEKYILWSTPAHISKILISRQYL